MDFGDGILPALPCGETTLFRSPDKGFWRSGADKIIFSFLHLIGGSVNISAVCFLYRIHGSNNFASSKNTGNKKYLKETTVNKLIQWNKKLRLDTLKMFIRNKKELIEEFNTINYYRLFFKVTFCINAKVCAKIIKTHAAVLKKILSKNERKKSEYEFRFVEKSK